MRGMRAHVERLTARRRVGPHQGLGDGRDRRALGVGELVVADETARVDEAVLDHEPVEPALAVGRERVPGRAEIGVFGLAALGRNLPSGEQRRHGGHALERAVAVPEPVSTLSMARSSSGSTTQYCSSTLEMSETRGFRSRGPVLAEADLEGAEALAEGDLLRRR